MFKKSAPLILSFIVIAFLQGCSGNSAGKVATGEDAVAESLTIETRLATDAHKAIKVGTAAAEVDNYTQLYKRRHTDRNTLNYAQLLRNEGKTKEASNILARHTLNRKGDPKDNVSPALTIELAAAKIELGEFKTALALANKVITNKAQSSFYADAHNAAGIALDAMGKHKQAENHLRLALEGWKGDSSSVKNNLAICLGSQGKFDEAIMYLRQALVEAPNKEEIVKNIELIESIRNSVIPRPKKK